VTTRQYNRLARRQRPRVCARKRPAVVDRGLFRVCCCYGALIGAMIVGCTSSQRRSSGDDSAIPAAAVVNYADAKHGLKLAYPGDWEEQGLLKPRGALLVLVAEDESAGLPPTVSVVAQPEQKPGSSAQATELPSIEQRLVERARKQVKDFELVESSDATVAGQPARRVVYDGSRLGMRMRVMNVLTVHNGRGYAIAYMADPLAFDARLGDVQRMIDSVEWIR